METQRQLLLNIDYMRGQSVLDYLVYSERETDRTMLYYHS